MKKLGKVVFMSEAEYMELAAAVRTSDKQFACGYHEGFNAGKWHSAGGYGKCIKETKAKLKLAQEQINQYKPIGEIFQPSEALTAILQDVTGISDVDAAADFEVVGNQVERARVTT